MQTPEITVLILRLREILKDRPKDMAEINENHHLYLPISTELIKKMATLIIHAKLSMTGKESDIFINRINHYLNIIE